MQPRHIVGAVAWGAFFSLAPIRDFIETGAILWVPILGIFEWRRTRRSDFLPGAAVRAAIVAAMVWAAVHAPLKFLDRSVGPFSTGTVAINQLDRTLKAHGIFTRTYPEDGDALVSLPAQAVSVRELFKSIASQTGLQYRVAYCGTGENLLFGMHQINTTFSTTSAGRSNDPEAP